MPYGGRILATILIGHCTATWAAAAEPAAAIGSCDLLVIAPHSDDEAIGCTGVMLRAIARGERGGVVEVTAGDGFPKAAAAAARKDAAALAPQDFIDLATLRQQHTLAAVPKLGVRIADIHFLGYPDGGLKAIDRLPHGEIYRQPFTEKKATYGTVAADYHTRRHGRPAEYGRAAIVGDLREIIADARPREIYVTSEIDTHADHSALFRLTREAAAAARYEGKLLTFVVHGAEPDEPPTLRITLTADELAKKRTTLEIYQRGVSPVHDRLAEEYAEAEERFWEVIP